MARLISVPPSAEPCLWSEECDRVAVTVRLHTILGEMPACQLHADSADEDLRLWAEESGILRDNPPKLRAL